MWTTGLWVTPGRGRLCGRPSEAPVLLAARGALPRSAGGHQYRRRRARSQNSCEIIGARGNSRLALRSNSRTAQRLNRAGDKAPARLDSGLGRFRLFKPHCLDAFLFGLVGQIEGNSR